MASPAVPSSQFLDFLASTLDRSQLRDDSDLVSALTGFAHAVAWCGPGRALRAGEHHEHHRSDRRRETAACLPWLSVKSKRLNL